MSDPGAGAFRRVVDAVYWTGAVVACLALVLVSAVIPWAVYTRYVLNSAASWPEPLGVDGDPLVFDVAADALAQIRKVKTEAKRSLRTGVAAATVRDAADRITALRAAESDVRDAGAIATLTLEEGDPSVDAELEPADA